MHAVTREGKLQVELAQLEYVLPRLRGMWGHLEKERLGGGRGARFGAGESQLETDRRLARKRIASSSASSSAWRASASCSASRARAAASSASRSSATPTPASRRCSTRSPAQACSRPTCSSRRSTRRRAASTLPEGREITLTDTVGFINKLPHGLVEAFKSTLDEVNEADLLLHVTDAGSPQREQQMQAVREVLAGDRRAHEAATSSSSTRATPLDARRPGGARAPLPERGLRLGAHRRGPRRRSSSSIADEAARGSVTLTVLVPYTRGDLVALAHERAQILSERHTDDGTQLALRISAEFAPSFQPFRLAETDE